MSQKAPRTWAVWAVCIAIIAAGFVAAWQVGLGPAGAQETPTAGSSSGPDLSLAMDPADYARLAELRQRLRLTDEALAGIGCDGPAAEAVLMRLREWHETNAAAWGARLLATAAARRELQAALRRVNVGPPGEAARLGVAQAKAALEAAMQAEREGPDSLRAYVGGALADAQRAAWMQLCAAPADAGPYAFAPGITKAQLTALALACTD